MNKKTGRMLVFMGIFVSLSCLFIYHFNIIDFDLMRMCTAKDINKTSWPKDNGTQSKIDKCRSFVKSSATERTKPCKLDRDLILCGDIPPYKKTNSNITTNTFQTVVEGELFITSAFFDERDRKGRIRIIALSTYAMKKDNIYCTIWSKKCNKVVSVKAKNQAISHYAPIQKPFTHLGYFFFCDTNGSDVPDYVSLSTRPCDNPKNLLEVQKLLPYKGEKTTIAHCLLTIHGLYDPYRIIEWFSLLRILGVDHVFVYDFHSISPDVFRVLNYFSTKGFITVRRWHMQDMFSVRAFAHRTMLNDCAYRAYGKYKYISNHDLDENIIPVNASSLKKYIQSKGSKDLFMFKSAHFCISRDERDSTDSTALRVTKFIKRKEPGTNQMKLICKPEIAVEMGIHSVVIKMKKATVHNAAATEAFVHHYRFWDDKSHTCNITDKSAFKFETTLREDINNVRRALKLPLL